MLETVKAAINNVDSRTFPEYFNDFVMNEQDALLEDELKHVSNRAGFLSINDIEANLNGIYESVSKLIP